MLECRRQTFVLGTGRKRLRPALKLAVLVRSPRPFPKDLLKAALRVAWRRLTATAPHGHAVNVLRGNQPGATEDVPSSVNSPISSATSRPPVIDTTVSRARNKLSANSTPGPTITGLIPRTVALNAGSPPAVGDHVIRSCMGRTLSPPEDARA